MKTLKTGYLKVDSHKIYYATYGNPKGNPWIFCHGGPGYHTVPKSNLKMFDLKKDYVILFDQRGCGKSRPHSSLEKNTTYHLVQDMVKILDLLKISKVNIYGGSWGSTLALVFAITNPTRVQSLVIKGVFLGRKKDINQMYIPNKTWSSEQKDKFNVTLKVLMKKFKLKNPLDGFKIATQNSESGRSFVKLWAAYEDLCCASGWSLIDFDKEYLKMAQAITRIEMFYFKNNCFLPNNFILKHVKKIKHIPVFIVQGGLDMVCPKDQALELAKHFSHVEIFIDPLGGHSNSEKMTKASINMIKNANKLSL